MVSTCTSAPGRGSSPAGQTTRSMFTLPTTEIRLILSLAPRLTYPHGRCAFESPLLISQNPLDFSIVTLLTISLVLEVRGGSGSPSGALRPLNQVSATSVVQLSQGELSAINNRR